MKETYSTLINGAVAGFLATIPMSGAMLLMHQLLPRQEQYPLPPCQITRNLSEKSGLRSSLDEKGLAAVAGVSHFSYGAAAGALYAATVRAVRFPTLVTGMGFGLVVWAGSYLGWLPALGILSPATEHPARRNALMIAAHIIWGSMTGVFNKKLKDRWLDCSPLSGPAAALKSSKGLPKP